MLSQRKSESIYKKQIQEEGAEPEQMAEILGISKDEALAP